MNRYALLICALAIISLPNTVGAATLEVYVETITWSWQGMGRTSSHGPHTSSWNYDYSGSAYTDGISMGFSGSSNLAQISNFGLDGLLMQVDLHADTWAEVSNDNSNMYANGLVTTTFDLLLRGDQPNGFYLFSFLQAWSDSSLYLNGTSVPQGMQSMTVQADSQGYISLQAVMTSESHQQGIGYTSENLSDSIRFQMESTIAVPEPTSMLLLGIGLGALGIATYRRRKN